MQVAYSQDLLPTMIVHKVLCVRSPVESLSPRWLCDSKAHHPTLLESQWSLRLLRCHQSYTDRTKTTGTPRSYQGQKKHKKLQKIKHLPRSNRAVNRIRKLRSFRRQHSTLAIRYRPKPSSEEEARRISSKPTSHRTSTSCNRRLCWRKTRIYSLQHPR